MNRGAARCALTGMYQRDTSNQMSDKLWKNYLGVKMDGKTALSQMVQQTNQTPSETETRYFHIHRGQDGTTLYYNEIKYTNEPPSVFRFLTDNLDEIVIWSVNPFVSEATAHEMAIHIGQQIGF
jgi:hypothetical protein